MTGQGIVIPEGDVAEVESRNAALQEELAPKSVMGAILVGQMATLSVRMERGAEQEFASVAIRVRHASEVFDAERVENATQLMKAIGDDPRGTRRRLLKSPEGIELLLEAWQDLRADLAREPGPIWDLSHAVRMTNLLGLREVDARAARIRALSKATWGNFVSLKDGDGAGLTADARQAWARAGLLEQIDEEIAYLEAHYVTLDFETIDKDRSEAGARALFDPSKEAALARRYESEARRGFFRSLKEFRLVEAEFEASEPIAPTPPAPEEPQNAPLASSCEEAEPEPDEPEESPAEWSPEGFRSESKPVSSQDVVIRGEKGRPSRAGRPILVPA
jgi:uncharacterized small protein (DUF1192 family)